MLPKTDLLTGIMAMAVLGSVTLAGWVLWRQWRSPDAGPPMVTVDLVRVMNAERKALPKLPGEDASIALLRIGRALAPTIRQVAGERTIVLVKQSVVGDNLPDITGAVLAKLGLPADAPTVDLTGALDNAPTTASVTAGDIWKKHLDELRRHNAEALEGQNDKALDEKLP